MRIRNTILTLLAAAPFAALADVEIVLPASPAADNLSVQHALLSRMINARSEADLGVVSETVPVKDGKAIITIDPAGPSRYNVALPSGSEISLYLKPEENVTVKVTDIAAPSFTVEGSPLMDSIAEVDAAVAPFIAQSRALASAGNYDPAAMQRLFEQYTSTLGEYISAHPASEGSLYALMQLSGDDFIKGFSLLSPELNTSILYPLVGEQLAAVNQQLEAERRKEALASGTVDAPAFTLKDTEGNDVSLSRFRGKYVVLDFWATWCSWCIKGFPKLKDTYAKYKDRMEVIGIDCRDPENTWKEAVRRHALPWVNVYLPDSDTSLLKAYEVQGFPTKVIISPEGKIVNITTGEDPAFYDRLASFLGE